MVEHSFDSVSEELNGSGLIDLMYPQYRILLTCMAEMADTCGGREFEATHAQIAKRSGGHPHGSITPELVSEWVFDFIRLGIVEVAPASGPVTYRTKVGKSKWRRISRDEPVTYRFCSYEQFVEMAEEIGRMQSNDDAPPLPPVIPKSSPMRTLQ
ncbi:MAG: hypothetical protein OXO50_09380 [Caldilineaceae bacterium]|nr:hypothetical protein [Caldilineaceae bacterium]